MTIITRNWHFQCRHGGYFGSLRLSSITLSGSSTEHDEHLVDAVDCICSSIIHCNPVILSLESTLFEYVATGSILTEVIKSQMFLFRLK